MATLTTALVHATAFTRRFVRSELAGWLIQRDSVTESTPATATCMRVTTAAVSLTDVWGSRIVKWDSLSSKKNVVNQSAFVALVFSISVATKNVRSYLSQPIIARLLGLCLD